MQIDPCGWSGNLLGPEVPQVDQHWTADFALNNLMSSWTHGALDCWILGSPKTVCKPTSPAHQALAPGTAPLLSHSLP